MSVLRFLLPLVLISASWARDPILEEVPVVVSTSNPSTSYRLPNQTLKPTKYDILLTTYFENPPEGREELSFVGNVTITLEQSDLIKTNIITLHAKNLNFNESQVTLKYTIQKSVPYELSSKTENLEEVDPIEEVELVEVNPTNITFHNKTDFVELKFEDDIPLPIQEAKDFSLVFEYTGTLNNDDLNGFYASSYEEGDSKVWLAATQFEPIGARRAFPCWDEPAFKATFDIAIEHSSDYTAISNMPAKEKDKDNSKKTQDDEKKETTITQFETTPLMSTYLVAFVVSKYVSTPSEDDNKFSVWTKDGEQDTADYALKHGPLILSALEDYTGFKYYKSSDSKGESMNMPKMDQIAIPQFWAGEWSLGRAMENWGLVTYKESTLLCTENVTTTRGKQDIATVISHELSHQWFGNLVTPEWWSYIWLNEGFATFFQYFTTDSIEETNVISWRLMEQFVVKTLQESAFVTDASDITRPMNANVSSPDQIIDLFDNIAYKKAACVIRMMQHFVKEDAFQKGLKEYLKNNKFKSVTPDDLYKAIKAATKPPLKTALEEIMGSWVEQKGYPVITVEREKDSDTAKITQKRFFLSGPSDTDTTKWYIPINFITQDNTEIKTTATHWMDKSKAPLTIKKIADPSKWVIFNNRQTGYYRVNYDENNWGLLAKYLDTENYEKLEPVTRAQLIDDSLNLARAGYLKYSTALPITLYLHQETDYIPWYAAIRGFDFMNQRLQNMSNYGTFKKYVAQKLELYVDQLDLSDLKNTTHFYQLGREMVLTHSCRYGLDTCKSYTKKRVQQWLNKDNKDKLPTDLRAGILCGGLQQADQKIWNDTLEKYKSSSDEKQAILNALGCVEDKEVIQTFLQLSLEEKNFPIDFFVALKTICANNYASFDVLIDFINENIEKIQTKDNYKSKLGNFTIQLSTRITNKEQYGKMTLFVLQGHVISLEGKELLIGKENLDWIDNYQNEISVWIEQNYHEPKTQGGGNSATSITMSLLMVIPVLIARFY